MSYTIEHLKSVTYFSVALAEEGKSGQIEVDRKHFNKKLPRVDLLLGDKEKEELIDYIRDRVKEECAAEAMKNTKGAEKVLNTKLTQLEQSAK